MTRAPAPTTWKDFVPLAGAALVIFGAIHSSGKQDTARDSTLAEHTRRIEQLEAQNTLIGAIDRRTTRIEVKLEMILPARRDLADAAGEKPNGDGP